MSWDWDADSAQEVREHKEIVNGTYIAFVDKANASATSGGTPYLNIQWRIVGGDFDNKCAFQKIWATEKAIGMYIGIMDKLGIKENLKGMDDTDEILQNSGELLTSANDHYEIYIETKDSDCGQYRNTNIYINNKYEGEVRDDTVKDEAPTFKNNEELPF